MFGPGWRLVFAHTGARSLRYEKCHINRTYPALVPAMVDGEVKETVIMNTGVLPVGVD